jgi:hypothetical protein
MENSQVKPSPNLVTYISYTTPSYIPDYCIKKNIYRIICTNTTINEVECIHVPISVLVLEVITRKISRSSRGTDAYVRKSSIQARGSLDLIRRENYWSQCLYVKCGNHNICECLMHPNFPKYLPHHTVKLFPIVFWSC